MKLCNNCAYRQLVESSEIGVVVDRCGYFKLDLRKMGDVKHCSAYEAKDLPYLFSREAWRLDKNEHGEWKFVDPHKD